METYSRIGLMRSDGNLQSYWTTTKLLKLTVVLYYYEAMGITVVLALSVNILTYGLEIKVPSYINKIKDELENKKIAEQQ